MTSYRDGRPTGLTLTRVDDTGRMFGSRHAVAEYANRSTAMVRKYCTVIACDAGTRAHLYDLLLSVGQLGVFDERFCCMRATKDDEQCGSPVMKYAPFALCAYHTAVVAAFWEQQDKHAVAVEAAKRRSEDISEHFDVVFPASMWKKRANVVYYLLVGAKVKIGWTGNIRQRMKDYPPNSELLVTEPGGPDLERERHTQFNEYLSHGREWFDPGPKLRAHIEALMTAQSDTEPRSA